MASTIAPGRELNFTSFTLDRLLGWCDALIQPSTDQIARFRGDQADTLIARNEVEPLGHRDAAVTKVTGHIKYPDLRALDGGGTMHAA